MSPTTQVQAQTESLLTAEQFLALPDEGRVTELVNGSVIELPPTGFRHGYVCANIVALLREFVWAHPLGRVVGNDAGVVTGRNPDTVRGPDVTFFSFERLPKEQTPEGYPAVAPDLVFEVRSSSDRLSDMYGKVGEYLKAGVKVVCLVDPDKATVMVYPGEEFPRLLGANDELTLPEVLPNFRVPVRRLFE
jgi:Uma2 family endonuclease